MRKLEMRDEPVTIGFLGGSITSGEGAARPKVDGYRFIFEQWLNRAFPKESRHQVVQFDEGWGTFESIRKGYPPMDLLVIDVTMNAPDPIIVEETLRQLLPSLTAVVAFHWLGVPALLDKLPGGRAAKDKVGSFTDKFKVSSTKSINFGACE